jgi:nicotinamidase/pyrazinamidase
VVDYDRSTALVVVDVQNDFADPKGSLYVGEGERIVPLVNRELERALAADGLVVYTQDWHPAQTPHFQSGGGVWPEHCVQYTWGAQLHPDLRVAGEVVRKGQGGEDGYSGFTVRDPVTGQEAATPLEGLLRRRGIGRVVVVGLATDYLVKETAPDAVRLGFDTVVLGGLVRAVDLQPGDGQRALAAMPAAGARIEQPASRIAVWTPRPRGWAGRQMVSASRSGDDLPLRPQAMLATLTSVRSSTPIPVALDTRVPQRVGT